MAKPKYTDAFENYLSREDLVNTEDPLGYWQALLTSPQSAPLARMALDVLSAPGKLFFKLLFSSRPADF